MSTRATARQTAIDIFLENFSEEWLFFLDDDFILNPGWWEEASRYTQVPGVGLIWGVPYLPEVVKISRWVEAAGVSEREIAIRSFFIRGGTHDTLLRRGAVSGVRIPPWLNNYEDAYIKKFVVCRGWQWRIVQVGGIHLRGSTEGYTTRDINTMIWATYSYGFETLPPREFFALLFTLPLYAYYGAVAYRNPIRGLRAGLGPVVHNVGVWLGRLLKREDSCNKMTSGV
ncbi:MAG: hypothetical protein QXF78_06110 [Pyrobaculum sp.]